jgi:membrane protein DedA with SNARE-associated domain
VSHFQDLISHYGLLAVFIGCLMEGESAALLGGFFAHQGSFPLLVVGPIAAVGSFLGDGTLYLLGRLASRSSYVQRTASRPTFAKALELLKRNQVLFILSNRFIYGIRGVGGIAVGVAGVPAPLFFALNAIAATVWASLFVGLGYVFGTSVELVIGRALHGHERLLLAIALGCVAISLAVYAITRFRRHLRSTGPVKARQAPDRHDPVSAE